MFIVLFLFVSMMSFCQTNDLVVFSEKGETFTLYVNSIKQNDSPEANVKAKDLKGESFVVRVVFENNMPELTKNIWTESKDVELSAVIKQNKKGKYVLRYMGETPRDQSVSTNNNDSYVNYESPELVEESNEEIVTSTIETITTTSTVTTDDVPSENIDMNVSISTSESNISVDGGIGEEGVNMELSADENGMTVTTGAGSDEVNMDVSVSENGMNVTAGTGEENVSMNININATGLDSDLEVTETVTTTTTITTSSNVSVDEEIYVEEIESQDILVSSRCSYAMSSAEFDEAISSVESKTFEDDKFIVAKQICKANCMTSAQVRDMNKVFDFEDTKLDFAMFAYDYVYDVNNYYKVNDSFGFEMTIDELDEYLETK
jgi:hypothetical protein